MNEAEELQIGFWILFGFLFPFPPLLSSITKKEGCLQQPSCNPRELNLTPESGLLGFKSAVSEKLVGTADLVVWSLMPSL